MPKRTRFARLSVSLMEERVNPTTFTWNHGGLNANWSTGANWVGGVAPTAANVDAVIVFNTADPNCVMDIVGMDVAKIDFDAGSDITLTLNTDLTIDGAGAAVNIEDDFSSTNSIVGTGKLVLTNASAVIEENVSPGSLIISAAITGDQGFTKTGIGTLTLTTTVGNTYTGTTMIAGGVLQLNTSTPDRGLSSNIVVGDGAGAAGSAVLQFLSGANFEIPDTSTLTINGDGRVNVPAGTIEDATALYLDGGDLNIAGNFQIESGGTVNSDGAVGSVIDGPGTLSSLGLLFPFDVADGPGATDLLVSTPLDQVENPSNLVKTGTGTLEFAMTSANTLTGATLIQDGVLLLNTNAANAALSGNITIGDNIGAAGSAVLRLVNASQIPDTTVITVNSDGLLDVTATASETVASLDLNTGGGFAIATGGVFQVEPGGSVDLANGVLTFNRTGPFVPVGKTVTLIDNLGTNPITGTFAGLPEGAKFVANGQDFTISYVGGTGNDVVLTAINTPPLAVADTLTTNENVADTINPLLNDSDPDGNTLTVTAVTQGAHGTVTFTATSVTYTPAANYSGPDSFNYTISDGNGGTATAAVSVTVNATNHPPVANPDTLVTNKDLPGTIDPLVNDTDADGNILSVTAVTQGANGTVTFSPTSVTYTPAANFTGTDSFSYTVSDGNGGTATATVSVTVKPGIGLSPVLGVSGTEDGSAELFLPNAAGQYATTPAATLAPFAGFTGSVRTATADVNGDGIADTILVTGPGTPIRVTVISGVDNKTVLVAPFDPFGGDFTGGGFVAAGDIDHDGKAEFVVTPDTGGSGRVCIFTRNADGTITQYPSFFGIDDPNFRGGARAALGDVNDDGTLDLAVTAGFLGGPRTALFDGKTLFTANPTRLVPDFFAFPGADATNLRNGAYVALGDINGDGFADLIFGAGFGGAPRVFILSGALVSANNVAGAQDASIANFFVGNDTTDRSGVRVAAKDADGDSRADLAVSTGEGLPASVRVYLGANFTGNGEPATVQDLNVFGGATLQGGVFVG